MTAVSSNKDEQAQMAERRYNASTWRVIPAIGLNTFREAVRNRILYIILIFALLLMASSGIVRDLTISAHDRVVRNLGLAAINFFGLAVAILVGINLVYNELDKKSIYTIVSKPVARWQFLLGKYFGLLLTIYVNILIMGVFFLAVINFQDQMSDDKLSDLMWKLNPQTGEIAQVENPGWVYAKYVASSMVTSAGKGVANIFGQKTIPQTHSINGIIFVTALELAIITAFAILYSSFSTPVLSAIFTIMTFIAGRLNQDIWAYAEKLKEEGYLATFGGVTKYFIAMATTHLVPNLGLFRQSAAQINESSYSGVNWVEFVNWPVNIQLPQGILSYTMNIPLPWGVLPYTLFYTGAILGLSILIFRSRNFK